MAADKVHKMLRDAEVLDVEDLVQLAHLLLERAKGKRSVAPRWREIRGVAESQDSDAQEWISNQRDQADRSRRDVA